MYLEDDKLRKWALTPNIAAIVRGISGPTPDDPIVKISQKERDHLKTLSYDDYLLSSYWERVRNRVLKRYDYCCAACGATYENRGGPLQVHHLRYDRGREIWNDVCLLCINCHMRQG